VVLSSGVAACASGGIGTRCMCVYVNKFHFSAGQASVSLVITCSSSSASWIGIAVTFKTELGDVPALTSSITAGTLTVAETTKGDKDRLECSEKGLCGK
jgi:hypothetical protein